MFVCLFVESDHNLSLEGFVPNVVCGNSVEPYEMSLAALGFQFCVNWGDIYRESLVSGPSWVPKQVNNIFMFIHTIDENVSRRLVNRVFFIKIIINTKVVKKLFTKFSNYNSSLHYCQYNTRHKISNLSLLSVFY